MWKDLTMGQRADVISMAVKAGMRDLNSIRSFYDESVGSSREYKKDGYPIKPERFEDGRHLYTEGGVKIGRPFWQSQAKEPTFMESLAEFNRQQELKRQQQRQALMKQRQALMKKINTVGRKLAEESMRENTVASNDNAWVETPILTRKKNPHLSRKVEEGAKAHAAWVEEHPILDACGMALGAAPLAVAAAPAVTVAGDALAGSAVGQGITAFLTNPYFDAAMTSLGGAHAAHSIANGEADWMTALELAPMTRLAKPMYNAATKLSGPLIDAFSDGVGEFNTLIASPYTGKWATFGNTQLRFKPNTLGMNGIPIESRTTPRILKELPSGENRYYRAIDWDALDSYRATGKVSQYDGNGILRSRYEVPMFTKDKPSLYRSGANEYGTVWVVSKPKSQLEWESVKGAAMSPKLNGKFNEAPVSDFDFFVYDPNRGYIQLDSKLGLPKGITMSRTPHIDYLNGLNEQQQIEYLTQNGLNDQWLWTLKNRPDHLESALSRALIPSSTDGGLVVSALPDFRTGAKTDYYNLFRNYNPNKDYSQIRRTAQEASTPKKHIDVTKNTKMNSDKRFMMFEPGRFINYDIGNMSVEEVVNTFGPEAEYYKKLYDVAKARNFEGKYAQIGKDAEFNILNRFAISKSDPDVAKGIEEARSIYSIPEYRARFNRWGTLGDTFVDDALARLDDVKLQGRSKALPIKGQHGVHGGAYTSPDATTIGITNSESSSWIQDMIRHEANHTSHGLRRQPGWMEYHNEKLRPVVREGKTVNTPESKYLDEMDEIVERSKTAVEYANKIRKKGETLNQALERLADMADANIYNADIPADVRQMIARFTKNSTLNFWKNFVGGYAIPMGLGLTGYKLFNSQEALEGRGKL